jgi:hypothetical protein
MLEMKNSTNQLYKKVQSMINRKYQTDVRTSGIEYKVKEILHSNSNKEKNKPA